MVFPGVLRGRPGPRLATILTSRPRRSLSSPGMLLHLQSSRATARDPALPQRAVGRLISGSARAGRERRTSGGKKRRGPGPLEEPTLSGPRTFLRGWRGLTPQWPRSLRLGSASGFKVARVHWRCNPLTTSTPHFPEKKPSQDRRSCRSPLETASTDRLGAGQAAAQPAISIVRHRLSLLPQWSHGQR